MNSLLVAGVIFVCCFGGALLGMLLRARLPESHLNKESQDVIMVATGLIATMAALVLGLLVAAASSQFDAQRSGYEQLAANIVIVDRALAHYGPETKDCRVALHRAVDLLIEHLWPAPGNQAAGLATVDVTKSGTALYDAISRLSPTTEAQKAAQSLALETMNELGRTRWQLSSKIDESIPKPFLFVLAFWLLMLFIGFGLFAPRNATVIVALFVCALSVAGAVLLIVDLSQPFEGIIRVSSTPLRLALSQLGQ